LNKEVVVAIFASTTQHGATIAFFATVQQESDQQVERDTR
jgi:hypothetical protein